MARGARSVWLVGRRAVQLRDEALPAPGAGQLQIQTLLSGISHGTEMLAYRGEIPAGTSFDLPTLQGSFDFPLKYGYAAVGRVARVGPGVHGWRAGQPVFALHPHQDRFNAPVEMVFPLPDGVSPERGVLFANLETALNALLDQPIRVGERVAVFGLGVVGCLIACLAKRNGAGVVLGVDPRPIRRSMARGLGTDLAFAPAPGLPERVAELSGGRGADVVFEASGNPAALQMAIDVVARNGTVVVCSWYGTKAATLLLGGRFHRDRLNLRGSQVGTVDPALLPRWDRTRRSEVVLELLRHLPLDDLITHRVPFEQAADAYRLIEERPDEVMQVVLTYRDGPS